MFAKFIVSVALLFCLGAAPAQSNVPPDELVETTVNELIDKLQQRRAELEQDKRKLYQMVEEVIVPHFAVPVIARLVLARHWREASEEQRASFAEEFKKLLIRTYATALFEYTGNEKMEVKPARIQEEKRRARVETLVTLPNSSPVPVNYSFILTEGEWKIYDVDIDGLSLVTNYRSTYGDFIRTNGLDALIEELARKNSTLENA